MSKFFGILLLLILFSQSGFAVHTSKIAPKDNAISLYLQENNTSADEFLELKIKDIRKAQQKRVTLKDRVSFMIAKMQFRKAYEENNELNAEEFYYYARGGFSFGGFLLGFFLPIIGNLIALLFGRRAWRSSWYGTLTALLVWLIGGWGIR